MPRPLSRIHANARLILRWLLIIVPIALAVGSVNALFLWLLEWATDTRTERPELLYFLPLAGLLIVFAYRSLGKNAESGNDLILDEIHEPAAGVPGRMAPLVLAGTVITHLFGGSAGREGTAIQIGGAISEKFCKLFRLDAEDRKLMLTAGIAAGIAAGFGAVFGTPLACFVAYAFSGHTGIYGSQRVAVPKPGQPHKHLTLAELRHPQSLVARWLRRGHDG